MMSRSSALRQLKSDRSGDKFRPLTDMNDAPAGEIFPALYPKIAIIGITILKAGKWSPEEFAPPETLLVSSTSCP
jgi:hypothetical protein